MPLTPDVLEALAAMGRALDAAGYLFDGVGGDFDLIVSNPPYLPDPVKRAYRHGGGRCGAGLSVAIVKAALTRLLGLALRGNRSRRVRRRIDGARLPGYRAYPGDLAARGKTAANAREQCRP